MEDAEITDLDIDNDIHLFAIFDGHGGTSPPHPIFYF